jgi:hypothetical protein
MLAGDQDRERAIEVLRDATVEGRLTLDEFAERVTSVELARTDDQLTDLTKDLPSAGTSDVPHKHSAFASRLTRSGRFSLARETTVGCYAGTIVLDLGHATLQGPETTLHVRNYFGTITLVVPRGVTVDVDGSGAFSTREISLPDAGPVEDAPRLHIRTSGMGGTLRIKESEHVRGRPVAGELRRGADGG